MALADVYDMLNKTTDPPGRVPTHDLVAVLGLVFLDHITNAEAVTAIDSLIEPPLTTAEKDGLLTLKSNYDGQPNANTKVAYFNSMAWTMHAVERGLVTKAKAGEILG